MVCRVIIFALWIRVHFDPTETVPLSECRGIAGVPGDRFGAEHQYYNYNIDISDIMITHSNVSAQSIIIISCFFVYWSRRHRLSSPLVQVARSYVQKTCDLYLHFTMYHNTMINHTSEAITAFTVIGFCCLLIGRSAGHRKRLTGLKVTVRVTNVNLQSSWFPNECGTDCHNVTHKLTGNV